MPYAEAQSFWAGHPLLGQTPDLGQRALSEIGIRRVVESGSLIFQKDDLYRGPYAVLEGTLKVYRTARSGRQLVLYLMRQGDVLAPEPLLESPARQQYLATAEAVTRCTLLLLPVEALGECLSTHPKLQKAMFTCLTMQLRAVMDQLEFITLYSVPCRLARYLVTHALSPDTSETPAVYLDVPKAALAAHLGTVPETLSRALSGLTEQGLISAQGATVYIKDLRGLRLLARGYDISPNGRG